ncbi:cytochrome P450 2J6-like [Rhipicephalus microplus]|uniref:cytochrome P450 2J6-like n=1 Tax=Rhipicephalus microplus TaxID=6941 RepID=UPI003F6C0D8D
MQYVLRECAITGLMVGALALLLQYLWVVLRRCLRSSLPPGPFGVPVLGYLPYMPRNHHCLETLRSKYGGVFGFHVGSQYVVFLCDFRSAKEALSQDALLNRPPEFPFNVNEHSQGLLVANGTLWKIQRRFSLKLFNELGITKPTMERYIREELGHLVDKLLSLQGKPVIPGVMLTPSVSNIISTLVFGRRFDYDDPERVYLDKLINVIPALAAQTSTVYFFPWVRKLLRLFRVGTCEKLREALMLREDFAESKIDEHHVTYKEGVVRDYIDGFLSEMAKRENERNNTFTRNVLKGNVATFFGAGSETVRSTMEWLLLMCAAKPELQHRMQREIDCLLVKSQRAHVRWEDRGELTYTQAFIWETMRFKPPTPLNPMRHATADIKVGGYIIPRGSIVIVSFWSLLHDKSVWGDPEVFRPERFLVDGGTRAVKPQQFIPFSCGKRSCPGESIASMEAFLYLTTVLNNFVVEAPPSRPGLVFDEVAGISLRPKPQKLIFRLRHPGT